jgi:hypothetical protein
MDRETRDAYLRQVYRVAKRDALFFNVNRHNRHLPQRDGGTLDNNPLLYPYSSDDRVLCWEECRLHEFARWHRCTGALAMMRAALINPGGAGYSKEATLCQTT